MAKTKNNMKNKKKISNNQKKNELVGILWWAPSSGLFIYFSVSISRDFISIVMQLTLVLIRFCFFFCSYVYYEDRTSVRFIIESWLIEYIVAPSQTPFNNFMKFVQLNRLFVLGVPLSLCVSFSFTFSFSLSLAMCAEMFTKHLYLFTEIRCEQIFPCNMIFNDVIVFSICLFLQ